MLSWNRHNILRRTLESNLDALRSSGEEVEALICDQGSIDGSAEYLETLLKVGKIQHLRKNTQNEGISKSFNQLILRASNASKALVLMGNDLTIPPHFITEAMKYHAYFGDSCGIIGADWGHGGVPPITEKRGVLAHYLNATLDKVFGTWYLPKSVIERIGFFHEGFHPYGLEDSDFNNRVNLAGLVSFYLPNMKTDHLGVGQDDSGSYRAMKDESLQRNLAVLHDRVFLYHKGLYETPPPLREPI